MTLFFALHVKKKLKVLRALTLGVLIRNLEFQRMVFFLMESLRIRINFI